MTSLMSYFDIPKGSSPDAFIATLRNHFTVDEAPARVVHRVYLDTFDWRIFSAGLQLECEIFNQSRVFILLRAETRHTVATFRTHEPIRFTWDLPDCALKKQLAAVIEMRALLPMITLRSRRREFNFLNKEAKTVLRARIEQSTLVKDSPGRGGILNGAMVLQSIRGYQKPYDTALSLLHSSLHLKPANQDVYTQALVKSKIQPGGYSSKLDIPLDPHLRADTAAKKILLHLLNTLQTNEQGTIEDLDTEFLHDYRVACRRTRAALSQIKSVFPQKTTERFKREFAWLGSITGPTRDLDVYLLTFDDYKRRVPEHLQSALEILHEFLRKQQTLEQNKLARTLRTSRYQRLITVWRQFLESPVPSHTSLPNAARPIIAVANERIWKMYKRVIHEGLAIRANSPPDDLHELRKSCKKLRYLLEFFCNLYPAGDLGNLVKALKHLQNNLGDYNDLHVQIESLGRFSKLMMEHEHPPAETLLAMGTLIESLDQKQMAVRREFDSQFSQFNAPEYHTLFKALFTGSDTIDTTEISESADMTHQ